MRRRASNYHHPNQGPPNDAYNNNRKPYNGIYCRWSGKVKSFQAGQFNKSLEKWTSDKEILQLIVGNITEFETIPLECHYLYNVKFSELETE